MKVFGVVHPVVLAVYVCSLELDDYSDMLDGYWDIGEEIPSEMKMRIEIAVSMFSMAESKALDILGSKERLQRQLELFHDRRGNA